MNDDHAERMIRLLEELRDGQRTMLERQALALQRQEEVLGQQRERLAGLSKRNERIDNLLASGTNNVKRARSLLSLAAVVVVLCLAVVLLIFVPRLAS